MPENTRPKHQIGCARVARAPQAPKLPKMAKNVKKRRFEGRAMPGHTWKCLGLRRNARKHKAQASDQWAQVGPGLNLTENSQNGAFGSEMAPGPAGTSRAQLKLSWAFWALKGRRRPKDQMMHKKCSEAHKEAETTKKSKSGRFAIG